MLRTSRLLLLTLVLLSACTTSEPKLVDPGFLPDSSPTLPEVLPDIASIISPGAYAVDAEVFVGKGSKPGWYMRGFVEFTDSGSCAQRVSINQAPGLFRDSYSSDEYEQYIGSNPLAPLPWRKDVQPRFPLFGLPASQEIVQPLGGLAWARTDQATQLPQSPLAGTWVDAHDPWFPLLDPVPLFPASTVSNLPYAAPLAGTGPAWCALPLLSYVALLVAEPSPGVLHVAVDPEKFCALERASLQVGANLMIDAYAPSSAERIGLLNAAATRAQSCGFDTVADSSRKVELRRNDSGFSLSVLHVSGSPIVVASFVSAASVRVDPPPGVVPFLELVSARRTAGASYAELVNLPPSALRTQP
jgi:hypothetical protein